MNWNKTGTIEAIELLKYVISRNTKSHDDHKANHLSIPERAVARPAQRWMMETLREFVSATVVGQGQSCCRG